MEKPENYNSKKKFEKYLKEKEGEPVNEQLAKNLRQEINEAAKGDYAVVKDEPSKEKLIASYPKGHLEKEEDFDMEEGNLDPGEIARKDKERYRTADMSPVELQHALTDLGVIRNHIDSFIKRWDAKNEIPDTIKLVIDKLSIKYGIHGPINQLPREIDKLIEKYTKALRDE